MNSFLNPHNGTSSTGVIDLTGHSISLFQEILFYNKNHFLYLSMILKYIFIIRNHLIRRIMYYNFYNDFSNFRKIGNISIFQQTYITNNITETNTQTINYVDNNYLNNNKLATIIVNPTPSLTENYLWIPETADNVVPGLNSLLTYAQSKYATLTSLQNSITNINNTINNEIQNIQPENDNIEITNPQNVSTNLSSHTSHTDFMYQRNITKNDNILQFVIQNHYCTYQRKGNHELQFQALKIIVAGLQNQINNLSSGAGSGSGGGEIGTM